MYCTKLMSITLYSNARCCDSKMCTLPTESSMDLASIHLFDSTDHVWSRSNARGRGRTTGDVRVSTKITEPVVSSVSHYLLEFVY